MSAGTFQKPGACDIALEAGHWIEMQVVDEAGNAIADYELKVTTKAGERIVSISNHTNVHGILRLEFVSGPAVTVSGQYPSPSPVFPDLPPRKLNVGQTHVLKLQ